MKFSAPLLISLIAIGAPVSVGHADVVTYEYTGTIVSYQNLGGFFSGGSTGQPITGWFTYNTDPGSYDSVSGGNPSTNYAEVAPFSNLHWEIEVFGQTIASTDLNDQSSTTGNFVNVQNFDPPDRDFFGIQTFRREGTVEYSSFFQWATVDGNVFNSTDLPTALSFNDFLAFPIMSFRTEDSTVGLPSSIGWQVESLTAQVPEPSSASAYAGLIVVIATLRRRKSKHCE